MFINSHPLSYWFAAAVQSPKIQSETVPLILAIYTICQIAGTNTSHPHHYQSGRPATRGLASSPQTFKYIHLENLLLLNKTMEK